MIRLLGDFLFFVSQILGILLIIGLIKPSLVSNIMKRLPDPIGEFFEKVTNRKKVLLVYGVSCLLLMIIGPTLSPVEHFETGKKYYEKEDWAGAVNNLSKVSTDDENYAEALELLSVAKENRTREQAEEIFSEAKTSFEEKKWSEVIDLLSNFPKDHSLTKEVDKLLTNAKEKKFDEDAEEILSEANKKLIKDDWDKAIEMLSDFPKDHRLFTEANSILTRATGRKVQLEFIDEWKRLKELDDTSSGEKHLKENRSRVDKWYGKVLKPGFFQTVSKNELLVSYEGIEFTLHPHAPLDESELSKLRSIERDNDKVLFSGVLDGEKSITLSGALSEPEMKVNCSRITNTDETIIYYEFTQKEIVAALKEAEEEAEKKLAGESERRIQSILSTRYDWVYPDYDNAIGAMKFASDGTFNYSTMAFGGMTRNGEWRISGIDQVLLIYDNGDRKLMDVISYTKIKDRDGGTVWRRY